MPPLSLRLIPRLAALWLQAVVLLGLAVASATGRPVLPSPAFGNPWGVQERLSPGAKPDEGVHGDSYDDRARRVAVAQATSGGLVARYTAVTFSGGLSVAEFESTTAVVGTVAAVQYIRGPDMGGGVGGLLRTVRNPVSASTTLPVAPTAAKPAIHRYNLSNGRGDIVAQSNAAGEVTWTASYEAYGKRTKETGANADKQRANTKDEDPTGLLNEGFRYRDLETGVWLSRDPAGFVDGPNLYAYVQQNPWSKFDAEGMFWSAIITAGFAAYDTYQYATGQTSGAEYSKAMALNGAALLADVSTGGMGGGLAVRALNAGVKVAKVVDKANNIVETAQAAVETTENIVSAVQEGDGRGVMRAAGAGILGAITDRAMGGKKGSGADQLYEVGRYKDMNKRNGTENHHTPGKEAEKELLGGDYDAAQDVAIRLPASAHRGKASEVDAVETLRPSMVGTPANGRELLAREIRVLRAATDAPNSALQKIIDTKKIDYPQHYGDEAKRLNKPPKD